MLVLAALSPTKALEKLLLKAKDYYYNTDDYYTATTADVAALPVKVKPGPITDAIYDKLEDTLRELSPSSPVLKAIGSKMANKKIMVKLPVPMPSLHKTKPGTVEQWLSRHKGPYNVSLKVDGASIELVYEPGKTVKVFTRGDGTEGGDISFLAPYLKIPQRLPMRLVVRGEAVMEEATFARYWKTEYRNARNMVAGITNRTGAHPGLKHVKVILYSQLVPSLPQSKALKALKKLGFSIVPSMRYDTLDEATLVEMLNDNKDAWGYKADGLVITQDKAFPPPRSYPDFAVAFKSNEIAEKALARVKRVVWQKSRTGFLIPVLEIEAI